MLTVSVDKHIFRRMHQLGYGNNYATVPVRIKESAQNKFINAGNEYYFLVSRNINNPGKLRIESSTDFMNDITGFEYNQNEFANLKEFSGDIFIEQTPNVDLEFIRVIPEAKN